MKRALVVLAGLMVALLALVASAGAAAASGWIAYESEVPAKLRRE